MDAVIHYKRQSLGLEMNRLVLAGVLNTCDKYASPPWKVMFPVASWKNVKPLEEKCSILLLAGGRMLSVFRQSVLGIRLTDLDGELHRYLQTYTPSDIKEENWMLSM